MQTRNRLLDDLARVASGALGVAAGMRGEIEARLRELFERVLSQMDLVTRDEFEAVKAMAAKAREEQELLAERLAVLEARPGARPARAAKGKPGTAESTTESGIKRTAPAKAGPARGRGRNRPTKSR
ncbi:MAG: accessory factor UbiK family protein [Kiloniellaceae bacterium]